jgi:hypothetical protein
MIVGFTGSRKGMTGHQAARVLDLLLKIKPKEGHHGDCIGSDAQFHDLCRMAEVAVVLHPPDNPKLRAFCKGAIREEEPLPYLDRNHIIVDECDLLLATPKEREEPMAARGQGTWSTIRYARRSDHRLRIVWPLGRA